MLVGIIITGHGKFASGLTSALEMIIGKKDNIISIDFQDGDSTEDLKEKLEQALSDFKSCDFKVFFTDIMGGTPFNTSVILTSDKQDCYVVCGTNLPLLLDFYLPSDNFSVENITRIKQCIEAAAKQIKLFKLENSISKNKES